MEEEKKIDSADVTSSESGAKSGRESNFADFELHIERMKEYYSKANMEMLFQLGDDKFWNCEEGDSMFTMPDLPDEATAFSIAPMYKRPTKKDLKRKTLKHEFSFLDHDKPTAEEKKAK